jgi:hypothetical protein
MDLQRTAHLAGVLLESKDEIHDIKGFGSQWFYLVYDVRDKKEKFQEDVKLLDIISRVRLGSLFDIMNSFNPKNEFRHLNPMLYADSQKEEALTDAKARLAELKKRHP